MLSMLWPVRPHENRVVLLLGTFTFFMLAATTVQSAISESLFINLEGAERLPYGIVLAQPTAVLGFYLYRLLRFRLRAVFINPVVVATLATGLAVVYYFAEQGSMYAIYALIGIGPLYSSVLAAESGRLSATLVDPRSARRLFPLLGTIGGAGASFGAFLVTSLTDRLGQASMLIVAGALMLVVIAPAGAIKESMRPRVTSKTATLAAALKNRYVLALLGCSALIIVLTTLVRFQFGAAAQSRFSGDELGVFYGQFALAINLGSIAFTLIVSKFIVNRLGAARSLLFYPAVLGTIAAIGTQLPGLITTAAAQLSERLFRQNIHNSASTIVGMPLPVPLKIRMALIDNGTVKPVAVLLASVAILGTVGEWAPAGSRLDWTVLYWPIAGLCLLMFLLLLYVRRHYARELRASLDTRRLQLDTDTERELPIDRPLRLVLHGYLASDLPERTALALEFLRGAEDPESLRIIRRQWPVWEPWLRRRALDLLGDEPSEPVRAFLKTLGDNEPDEVRTALLRVLAADMDADTLWEWTRRGGPATRAQALALLAQRGDTRANELMTQWVGATEGAERIAAAKALPLWPNDDFDRVLAELMPASPQDVLDTVSARPQPAYAPLCLPWLDQDVTYPQARAALQAIGEGAVSTLEHAALDPQGPTASFDVLTAIEGQSAHVAGVRLMRHPAQTVRQRATRARLHAPFEVSADERKAATENLDEALSQCERFHHYRQRAEPLERRIAESELGAAVDDVFLNLTLLEPGSPYREAHLAAQSTDPRQRSFAVELLDELLPNRTKQRLLPVLDGQPSRARFDMLEDRSWLELKQRLEQRTGAGTTLGALIGTSLFGGWRVNELEQLLGPMSTDPAQVVLRNGEPAGLEQTLLTGRSLPLLEGDVRLPLDAVYRALRRAPRCGRLWLLGLAQRVPEVGAAGAEVTRSGMVSLASRTLAEDRGVADAMDLWQRMFFLRSNPLTQDLPSARLRLMAEISRTITARAGEIVVHEGRLGNHFYLVCSGRLELLRAGRVVAELGPSDGFGGLALMRGQRQLVTVRAKEESDLIAISRVDFLDLLEVHPSLVRSFARSLAAQIIAATAPAEVDGAAAPQR